MSARADILSKKFMDSPTGKSAKNAAGGTGELAEIFASFVGYASTNWSYAAQPGAQKAPELLDGDGAKTVACGTLREAFKLMLREDLKLTVANADINERFLTKPGLGCFDPKVKGNVCNCGSAAYTGACHFSTHYFIETGGRYYDPCLMSVYSTLQGPIGHKTTLIKGSTMRKAGSGLALIVLRLVPGRSSPGFGEVWEILVASDCKRAGVLTPAEIQALKLDPDAKASKFV